MKNEQSPDHRTGDDTPDRLTPVQFLEHVERLHREAREALGSEAPTKAQIRLALQCGIDVRSLNAPSLAARLDAAQQDGIMANRINRIKLSIAARTLRMNVDGGNTDDDALKRRVHDTYRELQARFPVGSLVKMKGESDDKRRIIVQYRENERGLPDVVLVKSALRGNAWEMSVASLVEFAEFAAEERDETTLQLAALLQRIRSRIDVLTRDTDLDLTTARACAVPIMYQLKKRRGFDPKEEISNDTLDELIRKRLRL